MKYRQLDIYLEIGARRTFAAALQWPGWCRMGRDEASALENLLEYGLRYARILHSTWLGFQPPDDISELAVVERLEGNATTDFGAPDIAPTSDAGLLDDTELRRLQTILEACWRAFDMTIEMAAGKNLRTGPRGGGRALEGIVRHVVEAEAGYLAQLGGKAPPSDTSPVSPEPIRQAILETLTASAHGEIAPYGPRGGKRWLPRYFVRRDAWHVLDHVWEIEDRLEKHDAEAPNAGKQSRRRK
jgi:hypothetical protein